MSNRRWSGDPPGSNCVIIGCGPAGTSAAERIRELEPGSSVVVITDEPHPFYVREHLNRLIDGSEPEEKLFEKGMNFFDRIGVRLVHDRVVMVNTSARTVRCMAGSFTYDSLLVASGGKPRALGVPGESLRGVTSLYTLDDARALIGLLSEARRAAIVGCGTTAMKILPGLLQRETGVAVIERAPHVLPNLLDRTAAAIVEAELSRRGVLVHAGSGILRFEGKDGKLASAVLHDGITLPVDAAIVTVGIAPSVDFLEGSGVIVDRGIIVDAALRTNVKGVFAAGDVAQTPDPVWNGSQRLHPSWSLAVEQGRLAAEVIAGERTSSAGAIASNSLQALDLGVTCVGAVHPQPCDEVFARHEPDRRLYRKCVVRDGALVGCIVIDPSLPRKQVKKWLEKKILSLKGSGMDVDGALGGGPGFFS
jgi:NAD(P)H-nitrite reductase large subunit